MLDDRLGCWLTTRILSPNLLSVFPYYCDICIVRLGRQGLRTSLYSPNSGVCPSSLSHFSQWGRYFSRFTPPICTQVFPIDM